MLAAPTPDSLNSLASESYLKGLTATRTIIDDCLQTVFKFADSQDPEFSPNDPRGLGPLDCDVGDGKVAVYQTVPGNSAKENSQTPAMIFLDELGSTISRFSLNLGLFAWYCAAGCKETAIYHANELHKLASSTKVTVLSEADKTITDRYTLAIILSIVDFINDVSAKIPLHLF
jgi:hypothetical protein